MMKKKKKKKQETGNAKSTDPEPSSLGSWFWNRKVEGMGVGGYLLVKAISGSDPNWTEIAFVTLYVVAVTAVKQFARSRFGRAVVNGIADVLDSLPENIIYRDWRPHDLIQWLTKGRFDCNVACKEKLTFQERRCLRSGCRFDCEKKNDTPDAIWQRIPRRTKRMKRVRIGPRMAVVEEGELGPPGDLVGWNAFGIAFRTDNAYWRIVEEKYGNSVPVELMAYVRLGLRLARLRIEPRKTRADGNDVVIYGKYRHGYEFEPDRIRRDKRKWISVPICGLLASERGTPTSDKRTLAPVINS